MHEKVDSARDLQWPAELIGTAPSVRHAADVALRAVGSSSTILIVAEAGFSPERIARAIHEAGPRAGQPFITVDCADGPASVLQLFGSDKPSRSEYETAGPDSALVKAGGGTILLSGVGEMAAGAQVRVSRLLRDGELRVRKTTATVKFRVIAATTPDLEADVHDHRFRPDLYRRLQGLRVDVPPLRDRSEDLPALIDAVLAEMAAASGTPCRLAPAARTALAALRWPGNLDELRGSLTRLVERSEGHLIRQEDVLADLQQPHARPRSSQPPLISLRDARRTFERDYISTVLEAYGWRMTEAARVLGIERANLYRKTRQLGITRLKPSRSS